MRVLIHNDIGVASWAYGFARLGHDVAVWSPDKMKAFKAFEMQSPDLYVGPYSSLSPALLRSKGKCILALWDELDGDAEALPGSFIFSVAEEHGDCAAHAPWPYSGDEPSGQYFPPLACDVTLLGEHDRNYDPYLMPLLEQSYVARAYGKLPWATPYYAGNLEPWEELCALSSCKVLPLWGRAIQDARYILRAIHNGCLPVLAGYFNGPVPQSEDADHFVEIINQLVADEDQRISLLGKLRFWAATRDPLESAQSLVKAFLVC